MKLQSRGARRAGLVLGLLAGTAALHVVGVPVAAWAQEAGDRIPPELAALADGEGKLRPDAVRALRGSEQVDVLLDAGLNVTAVREALPSAALAELCRIARERGVTFVNNGMRRLLRNGDAPLEARKEAANTLAETGNLADVTPLGDALPDLPDEAARALAAIGGEPAIRALHRGGGDDPPVAVRAALAKLGDDAALPELVAELDALEGAERSSLAGWLEWATGRSLGTETAAWTRYLRVRKSALVLADEDEAVATAALKEMVTQLESDPDGELADDLIAILGDPSWHIFARNKAALALGLGGVRKAKDALLAETANQKPGSLRLYAAEALARVGDLSIAVPFASMLVHDEDRDRLIAMRKPENRDEFYPVDPALVRTLFRLGVPGGVSSLVEVMGGQFRTRMHRDCLRALREVTDGEQFGYEPDASADVRRAAWKKVAAWWETNREMLTADGITPAPDDPGWTAFRVDVDRLIETLGTFKFLYQLRAKKALIIVAEPALPQILAALDHPTLHVRTGASEVLAGTRLRAAVPALAKRFHVEESPVGKAKMLVALVACTGPRGDRVPPFGETDFAPARKAALAALGDRSIDVRVAGAELFGNLPDPDGTGRKRLLEARKETRNDLVAFRMHSAAALLNWGDRSGLADLLEALGSDDIARRTTARDLLARGGVDVSSFDPDATDEQRAEALRALRTLVSQGGR